MAVAMGMPMPVGWRRDGDAMAARGSPGYGGRADDRDQAGDGAVGLIRETPYVTVGF
ncbi:hypothetical protein [Bifidobacterium mongoliense]|uniref:hypothetical protein n=1 Tax=Bifidobacterium mongoliense TaxID=518643 RepID=UPI002647F6C6|nr:hypothetical protein [Bifidobacterium mongoliense]